MRSKTIAELGIYLVCGVLVVLLFASCSEQAEDNNPSAGLPTPARLKAAGSSQEFELAIRNALKNAVSRKYIPSNLSEQFDAQNTELSTLAVDGTRTTEFSGTNLIEQGVDEADLVKTDGNRLYIAKPNPLPISILSVNDVAVDALIAPPPENNVPPEVRVMQFETQPALAKELYTLKLPQGVTQIHGMYLGNDSVSNDRQLTIVAAAREETSKYYYWSPNTVVLNYKVESDSAAELLWSFKIDSYHNATRVLNGKLYLLASKSLWVGLPVVEELASTEEQKRLELIDSLTLENILPKTWVDGQAKQMVRLDDCLITSDPTENSLFSANLLSILVIPLDNPNGTNSTCTPETSHEVYVSSQSIFVTSGEYDRDSLRYFTHVHKFAMEEDRVVYASSGKVPGWAGWWGNNFRLNEHNGDLRIITSEFIRPTGQEHRLFVLRDSTSGTRGMDVIAQIPNKARPGKIGKPSETIRSVRFGGDYAYVVTFLVTDPFYAINLKDPTDPYVEGEFELPGFSQYLHIVDNDTVLGVGKDVELENGLVWEQGVRLSLFDVRDKSNPQMISESLIGKRGTQTPL
ncbi:MAG: beta-propeller domain-containing protein, partial [Gammaproteobacteria bacterium]|nr:beta-propeller domain-containing protein [Gammaproteobacteria bacterium]